MEVVATGEVNVALLFNTMNHLQLEHTVQMLSQTICLLTISGESLMSGNAGMSSNCSQLYWWQALAFHNDWCVILQTNYSALNILLKPCSAPIKFDMLIWIVRILMMVIFKFIQIVMLKKLRVVKTWNWKENFITALRRRYIFTFWRCF